MEGLVREAVLVAIGAVPGAWLRFRIVNHLEPLLPRRHWGTFGVNLIACFALGLLTALQSRCGAGSERLMLLLSTGFLGGFSTFSTFVAELVQSSQAGHARGALALMLASVAGGLLALIVGRAVGG
ncbi:MAG: fluoride efflux transporter FluC [Synechococcaceae cyanobacterium]